MVESLRRLIRPELRDLQPYEPEPPGAGIRLDANESPWDVPADLKADILKGLQSLAWNRYPDPEARRLRERLAGYEGLPARCILVGNGSDEIIRDLLTVFGGVGARTVFPTPTFSMYAAVTQALGGIPVGVPWIKSWVLDVAGLLSELNAPGSSSLAFLASPNNPTGNSIPPAQLEEILENTDRLVVWDEAYALFARKTLRDRLAKYPHLAILKTLSKSMSGAGIRLGYLLANPEVIQALNRVRLPYNVDALTQYIAERLLEQPDLWSAQAERVILERDKLSRELGQLPDCIVYPSEANFVLIRHPLALDLKRALNAEGVAVRGFSSPQVLADCLRITVGRPEENVRLLDGCRRFLLSRKG